MTTLALAAVLLSAHTVPVTTVAPVAAKETPAKKAKRMAWFKEARFGLFLHWGLYSVLEGEWKGSKGHAEWIRNTAHIPINEYDQLVHRFDPVKFDPDAWCEMAKAAGMKYIVLTTKHHDGFNMFASKYTDFNVMNTPYGKDITRQLAEACKRHGLKMCFYHSIMDWHHPDYLPRRDWETDRPTEGADFDRFVKYLRNDLTQLLTDYGPVGIMWFDGEWEKTWNHKYGQALYDLCRKLQPNVIVNNRVDIGRGGMGGMSDAQFAGDYGTPEQEVPAEGIPGVDWESCITMNNNWGYNAEDKNFKSSKDLIHMLVDVVSKGGNLLLNIGPKPDGTWPQESIDRMHDMAAWMKVNEQSIHGTDASPFGSVPFGRVTCKPGKLYLHVFDWPADGKIRLMGMENRVSSARLLGGGSVSVASTRGSTEKILTLPSRHADSLCPVIEVVVSGSLKVHPAPKVTPEADAFADQTTVTVTPAHGDPSMEWVVQVRDASAKVISTSTLRSGGSVTLKDTGWVSAYGVRDGRRMTDSTWVKVRKLALTPATKTAPMSEGLYQDVYSGSFDTVPDFTKLHAEEGGPVKAIDLSTIGKREGVGLWFRGFVNAPETGLYTFRLTSDDGSKLTIDDQPVVDNDGLHGSTFKTGQLLLEKGWHKFDLGWFNRTGGQDLKLEWAFGRGKFTLIPGSAMGNSL